MRSSFIFLLVIGSLLFSVSAEGAEWKFIAKSKEGDMNYVDTESIRHISKTVVRAWFKVILKNPKLFHSKEIIEYLGYEEHDCVERKLCLLQLEQKYSDGTNTSDTYPEKEWSYVRPGTIEYAAHNYLCKGKK